MIKIKTNSGVLYIDIMDIYIMDNCVCNVQTGAILGAMSEEEKERVLDVIRDEGELHE